MNYIIEEGTGVRTYYGGGDYHLTVWKNPDEGYDLVYCRSNSRIAFDFDWVSEEDLSKTLELWGPDWFQVTYEEVE